MSSPETPADDPDIVDMLAAEFVLGTLDRGARLDLEDRREVDALLDERVRWWEQRLQPLALAVPAVAPSAECRRRIVRRVHRRAAEQAAAPATLPEADPWAVSTDDRSQGAGGDLAARRGVTDLAAARRARHGEEMPALGRWRAFGIAASLLALSLGVLLAAGVDPAAWSGEVGDGAVAGPEVDIAPRQVAAATDRTALSLLRDADGRPRFIVEIRSDDSVSITALDREPATPASSLQLWMADGVSGELRPVGLLPDDPWSSVRLDDVALIEREPAFAVSIEPPGGSPEPGPTGDVVFQGTIHPIGTER